MGFGQDRGTVSVQAQKITRLGVLLLAHGGQQEWNEEVHHVADRVDLTMPTEIAFGMAARSTIQEGINRLTARGVMVVVAIPLFVSSHSSVIDSTAYLLGLRSEAPNDLKMFAGMDPGGSMNHQDMIHNPTKLAEATKPVTPAVPKRLAAALDHHPVVAEILADRASSISRDPEHEVVILVAHGPVAEEENKLWLNDMSILADEMRKNTHYAGMECLTLRDDAEAPVKKAATERLRRKVEQVVQAGDTALVVPLLLSYGGIEGGIRKRLFGLAYRMPLQGLLPDERMVNWVIETARSNAMDLRGTQH